MTEQQRIEYRNINTRQRERLEAAYIRPVFKILHEQAKAIATIVGESGAQAGINAAHRIHTTQGLTEAISGLHITVGLFYARKADREIIASVRLQEKAGTLGRNEKWTQDIINYFKTELFNTVSGITQTTVDELVSTITKGIDKGWSIEKMVHELQTPDLLLWRARLIARTEVGKAAFAGREIASKDSDWETDKEWISAHDNRVRPDHQAVDGTIIPTEEHFIVGGERMVGPGDPNASAKQICNCRCTAATMVRRDTNGNMIRKRGIIVIRPGAFNKPVRVITIGRPAAAVNQ